MGRFKLTGFSLPWLGLSWEITGGEAEVARRLIAFLEDRRVLFHERSAEDHRHCLASVQTIRSYLTNEIGTTKPGTGIHESVKLMRAAARRFADSAGPDGAHWRERLTVVDPFSVAFGDLRVSIGVQLAILAEKYDLTVDRELASILPPKPRRGD
jgi:hypothetical protein